MNLVSVIVALILSVVLALLSFNSGYFQQILADTKAENVVSQILDIKNLENVLEAELVNDDYSDFTLNYFSGLDIRNGDMIVDDWKNLPEDGNYDYIYLNDNIRLLIRPIDNDTILEMTILFKNSALNDTQIKVIEAKILTRFDGI